MGNSLFIFNKQKEKTMALLKEDGSLDIEWINKLPLEEKKHEMSKLTKEQIKEYASNLPINESNNPVRVLKVNYKMEDLLGKGYTTAEQISKMIRENCK